MQLSAMLSYNPIHMSSVGFPANSKEEMEEKIAYYVDYYRNIYGHKYTFFVRIEQKCEACNGRGETFDIGKRGNPINVKPCKNCNRGYLPVEDRLIHPDGWKYKDGLLGLIDGFSVRDFSEISEGATFFTIQHENAKLMSVELHVKRSSASATCLQIDAVDGIKTVNLHQLSIFSRYEIVYVL